MTSHTIYPWIKGIFPYFQPPWMTCTRKLELKLLWKVAEVRGLTFVVILSFGFGRGNEERVDCSRLQFEEVVVGAFP